MFTQLDEQARDNNKNTCKYACLSQYEISILQKHLELAHNN